MQTITCVEDLREIYKRRVPKMFIDYAESGSYSEQTLRWNREDLQKIKLKQKILTDVSKRDTKTTIAGKPVNVPLVLAPIGLCGMQHANGEILAAKAAAEAGIPFTLSTMSVCSIEDVASETNKPFWFQLYVMKDRPFVERLIDRAKAAKCPVLVLTMDLQILGQRHKDIRNGLRAPPPITPKFLFELATKPAWALGMLQSKSYTFGNIHGHVSDAMDLASLAKWTGTQFDLTLNWKDIAWIKDRFGGPVVVKGILDPEDAQLAIDHGADGIIVSNHGGRQLDGAPSSIRVLPEIVDAVGHKTEVLMDSGIRSGQDVLKALALGAKGTFVGRAMNYGLGAGGEEGVLRALNIITKEIDTTMALMGERDIRNVGPHNIYSNDLLRRQGY